jgi:hypothetical protein
VSLSLKDMRSNGTHTATNYNGFNCTVGSAAARGRVAGVEERQGEIERAVPSRHHFIFHKPHCSPCAMHGSLELAAPQHTAVKT